MATPQPATYTKGVDVSFYQDDDKTPQRIDWEKVPDNGAKFAYIRAGQKTWVDNDWSYNWREAKAAGLLRGAYWFYDYRHSALTQADLFWSLLKDDPGELPPAIDVEFIPGTEIPKAYPYSSGILSFVRRIKQLSGRQPVFYSNPSTIKYLAGFLVQEILDCPLWVANYGVDKPYGIAPWKQWTFWQWTAKLNGLAHGMESKDLDGDWFNGDEDALRAFAGVVPPAVPEPETHTVYLPQILAAIDELEGTWEASNNDLQQRIDKIRGMLTI